MDSSFRVRGHSDRFEESDPAWLDQYAELSGTMTHLGLAVSRERMGALDTIIVAVTSTGDLKQCAEAWRAWLGRDDSRWIELTDAGRSVVLRASDLADGQFDRALEAFYPAA